MLRRGGPPYPRHIATETGAIGACPTGAKGQFDLKPLRRAVTVNAEANAPMLAVNRQMGYEVYRREAFYQVPREAIGAWLAARG